MTATKNVMTGTPKAGTTGYLFRASAGTAIPADEKDAAQRGVPLSIRGSSPMRVF